VQVKKEDNENPEKRPCRFPGIPRMWSDDILQTPLADFGKSPLWKFGFGGGEQENAEANNELLADETMVTNMVELALKPKRGRSSEASKQLLAAKRAGIPICVATQQDFSAALETAVKTAVMKLAEKEAVKATTMQIAEIQAILERRGSERNSGSIWTQRRGYDNNGGNIWTAYDGKRKCDGSGSAAGLDSNMRNPGGRMFGVEEGAAVKMQMCV
jgi:hypothetical protein